MPKVIVHKPPLFLALAVDACPADCTSAEKRSEAKPCTWGRWRKPYENLIFNGGKSREVLKDLRILTRGAKCPERKREEG